MSEALRLAEAIDSDYDPDWLYEIGLDEISAELRRLHAQVEKLEADAARWRWVRRHWKTCNFGFYRDGTLKRIALTLHVEAKNESSGPIDSEVDAAIAKEQT